MPGEEKEGEMTREFDERNARRARERCSEMARAASTGKRVLTEREKLILDMWPRFEDGKPVMLGDKYEDNEGHECFASGVHLDIDGPSLVDSEGFHDLYRKGKRVKRPAPKVLDADGVEIEVGDTVWTLDGLEGVVTKVDDGAAYIAYESDYAQREEADNLTHVQPDSWERLEEDAESIRQIIACNFGDFSPSDFKQSGDSLQDRVSDLVRRAKALAGVEVEA